LPNRKREYGSALISFHFLRSEFFFSTRLVKIDQHRDFGLTRYSSAMKKPLTRKQILAVRCPTCGAAPLEKCELSTGLPRTDPHFDRRVIAKEPA
jgi:hypothetical protein